MPDASVIINAKLDSENLTKQIDKLVDSVTTKFDGMATSIQESVDKVKTSIRSIKDTARSNVSQIKQAFDQLGTTFDQFARAMERAARATSGANTHGGTSGNAGGGGSAGGSATPPTGNAQTLAELKQIINEQQKYIENLQIGTRLLQEQVDKLAKQKQQYKDLTTSSEKLRQRDFRKEFGAANSMSTKDIAATEAKLAELRRLMANLKTEAQRLNMTRVQFLPQEMWNRLQNSIDTTEKKLERLRNVASKPILPTSINGVMGMSERTLNDISLKMKAITQLRAQTPVGSTDISRLNAEYARLSRLQTEIIGKNATLVESNNALGRAFNYIRNRLAFTLTIGAFTGFVRQLYEVRGQYELLERSLGVLVNSFSKGSQIFNQLSAMAIKSPFTLIELGTAAKQLTAYNFEANEVVNTTKRLADISAALGVPMERLVYNLGQIRAQTVLTARDARDFANAGLAIVPELAKYYTELEGRVVSTADVFDRMKKKAVSYNDTMAVLYKLTDEGGKFFDFQAKQAGTLKVQMANLNLAWNNMLNDIGKSNQGALSAPISALRTLFLNWRIFERVLREAVYALGAYKALQIATNFVVGQSSTQMRKMILADKAAEVTRLRRKQLTQQLNAEELHLLATSKMVTASDYERLLVNKNLTKTQAMLLAALNRKNVALLTALIRTGQLTAAEIRSLSTWKLMNLVLNQVELSLRRIGSAILGFVASNWFFLVAGALYELYQASEEAKRAIKEVNRAIIDGAKESFDAISQFNAEYSKVLNDLYKFNDDGSKQGILSQEEGEKAWEAMKNTILQSTAAANLFLNELESIDDMNDRLRKGFALLSELQDLNGVIKNLKDDAISFSSTTLWGLGGEGLKDDLSDYMNSVEALKKLYGDVDEAKKKLAEQPIDVGVGNVLYDLQEIQGELDKTAEDLVRIFADENKFGIEAQREAFEIFMTKYAQEQQLDTQQYYTMRVEAEERYYNKALAYYTDLAKHQADEQKALTLSRIEQLKQEFNSNKTMQDNFFSWLSDEHSSNVVAMMQNKSKEEIKQGEWLVGKNKEWLEQQTRNFAQQYGYKFDELWKLVSNANTWSIIIPVYFNTIKPVSEVEKALNSAGIPTAYTNGVERATDALSNMKKEQKGVAEEIETVTKGIKAGIPYSDKFLQCLKDTNKQLTENIHSMGGLTDAEEKALKERNKNNKANKASKAQKHAEDAVAKALSQELSIIKEMQSNYDKLRKAGVNTTDALALASSGYDKSLKSINATLSKYGIKNFKAEDFVGSGDPHKLLNALQKQLDTLVKSGKVKTSSLKDLEVEIQKIRVDAREYDLKKVTDGLNNELGKIKEEYELGVELDANPELGEMFAEAFGIDMEKLPKTAQEAIDRIQDLADKKIGDFLLAQGYDADASDVLATFDVLRGDLQDWANKMGVEMDSEIVKALANAQKESRDFLTKETRETIKDWEKLLEKYSEYEVKKKQIQQKAEKERETARKIGAKKEIFDAIDLMEKREYAQLDFDEFQKSAEWITATGDLSKLTSTALQMLIEKLLQYKNSAKYLDPKQIKKVNDAIRKMYKELRKNNPFAAISLSIQESAERMELFEPNIEDLENKIKTLQDKWWEQGGWLTAEDEEKLEEYNNKLRELIKLQNEAGKQDSGDWIGDLSKYTKAAKSISDSFKEIADSIGDEDLKKAADITADIVGNFEAAEKGAETWGGWWGAIIGGVTDMIPKIIKWASGDNAILEKIKDSQVEVKNLELAYKQLEHATEKAFGTAKYGAQQALIANKKLQLAQLEYQLQLEESRDSKHRDDEAILSLKCEIIDLRHEIANTTDEIVNDLLGISSVGDFAENLVKSMIEAFKSGEDYMKVFEESFEDMVDNMIMKAIVSRLIGDFINQIFDQIKATKVESEDAKSAQAKIDALTKQKTKLDQSIEAVETYLKNPAKMAVFGIDPQHLVEYLKQLYAQRDSIEKQMNDAINEYNNALAPTPEDVNEIRNMVQQGKGDIQEQFKAWMDAFGIQFGQNKEGAQLSALQQGIANISETTAEALEAYMNSVSQQVYYQSDILTQIRDILVNFGGDVTIATNAQILFELQQSTQIQMSIQSILQGWSNASGLAVRVELAN